jgi:hypothetical protein
LKKRKWTPPSRDSRLIFQAKADQLIASIRGGGEKPIKRVRDRKTLPARVEIMLRFFIFIFIIIIIIIIIYIIDYYNI